VEGDASLDNPFAVTAPRQYMFYGMLSFVCFGPLTANFSVTLAFGTPLSQTPKGQKENSCAAQRMKEAERRDAEHSVGHGQGMNMQGKFTMGLIAQKEDDAEREERQMRFLALTKKIDASQKLLDTMILIAEKMSAEAGSSVWSKISDQTEKIESMLEELEEQQKPRARVTNSIVSHVLEQASMSIGVDLGMMVNAHELAELDEDVMLSTINEDSGFL
jgi:hypothetical protein